jgi:Domain of unknown function (DUF4468) with TBP-like fold
MNKLLISIILTLLVKFSIGQDSLLTYSKILKIDSVSKNDIFDRTLIWCSKSFNDSKSAINVKEREGGIIGGKAYYLSSYKIPKRKDSTSGVIFNNYYFDWLIEIKEGKLRFSATNILLKELNSDYIVSTKTQAPFEVWLQPKSKTELDWKLSKEYFIKNLDRLMLSLNNDLVLKKTDW